MKGPVANAESLCSLHRLCAGKQSSEYLTGLSMLGVQQIDRVVEVVEETLKGNSVKLLGSKRSAGRKTGGARLDLPKIRRNPLVEIIAINTGCLNQCTYCKTKHARGELGRSGQLGVLQCCSSLYCAVIRPRRLWPEPSRVSVRAWWSCG